MIKSVSHDDNTVTILSTSGKFEKLFEPTVKTVLQMNDRLVVLISLPPHRRENQNIYCLNEKAEVVWQVQDPDTYRPGLAKSVSPFTGIWVDDTTNILKAMNWNSHVCDVDITTGRLSNAHWTK